jgi:hypothetical protein
MTLLLNQMERLCPRVLLEIIEVINEDKKFSNLNKEIQDEKKEQSKWTS